MEAKKHKWWIWIIVAVVLALAGLYLGVSAFYGAFTNDLNKHRFIFGTRVNGYYATGLTVSELNEKLTEGAEDGTFTIIDNWGTKRFVSLNEVGFEEDYTDVLAGMLSYQDPFLWFKGLPLGLSYRFDPQYSYNEDMFKTEVKGAGLFDREGTDVTKAYVDIRYDEDKGFYLYEDLDDTINSAKTMESIGKAILAGEDTYTMAKDDLNVRQITAEDRKTYELWEKIKEIQDVDIAYDFGDTVIKVDSARIAKWITDEDGNLLLDEDGNIAFKPKCIEDFVADMSKLTDNYHEPRQFTTTAGNTITIDNTFIGTRLNQAAEIKYLKEAIPEHVKENRTPTYYTNVGTTWLNGVGNTYIEIDRANQTMYYYVDGELIVQTPVVTGNLSTNHGTPSMICPITSKSRDTYLVGPGYRSFVNYWMHIHNGIGIHDAKWRDEFGGEIYKTAGSHGCINTPDEAVETIYNSAPVGTIVVIY